MSNLLVLGLIAKAAYDSQHRSSSSSSKSSINSNNSKHYNSSSDYTYKLIDSLEPKSYDGSAPGRLKNCVNSIIENTPEIKDALAPYIEALEKEQNQREKELNAELETFCEPSARIVEKYTSAFEALSETGFEAKYLTNPPGYPKYGPDPDVVYDDFLYVRPNPNGPHASYHSITKDISLDGVQIKRSDIEAGINPFEKELSEFLKKHPTYQKELDTLTAAASSLENKKIALFLSSRKKEELAALKEKLSKVNLISSQVKRYQESAEKFRKLSPEQKAKVTHFFDVHAQFEELSDNVSKSREKSLQNRGYGRPTYIQDLIELSDKNALASLTPEQRKKLDNIPSIVAEKVLALDDKEFTKLAKSYYYGSDGYHPRSVIRERFVNLCREKTLEQHQLNKAAQQEAE